MITLVGFCPLLYTRSGAFTFYWLNEEHIFGKYNLSSPQKEIQTEENEVNDALRWTRHAMYSKNNAD